MIRKIIITGISATAMTSVGWTAEQSKEPTQERIGLASGAVLGGLAGGPLGVVLGAAFGGWLGDEFDEQRHERDDFEERWEQARAEVASLNGLVQGTEHQLAQLTSEYGAETAAMREKVRDALDVQVLFKTGDTSLAEETDQRLTRLAELVAGMDGMLLRIEGHADARGAAEFNEQLSAQRAATVRDVLIRAGVPSGRIVIDALGEREANAVDEDIDGMALDRRVQLTLIPSASEGRMARE
ncbi:MAG: OmpA family protein [Gammaproteobacteria bacterium]|nr:OmpA family protein [Gammaproteobacteria bacterium]